MHPREIDVTNCRHQIDRLARSSYFRQSANLQLLLRYLAERTLAGRAEGLKEYAIGVEALGRAPDYDPQTDSSVRVQINRLRAKLAQYYAETPDDDVLVSIPKGGFTVRFEKRALPETTRVETETGDLRLARWRAVAIASTAAAIALAIVVAARSPGAPPAIDPDVATLWAPHLTPSRATSICIGIPLFLRVRSDVLPRGYELTVRQPVFNDWDPAEAVERLRSWNPAMASGQPTPFWNFMGAGEGLGAFHLANLLARAGVGLKAIRGHVASWDDLSAENVIYLGGPKFNPKLREMPASEHFLATNGGVVNSAPRDGEPREFPNTSDDSNLGASAVVSRRQKANGEGVVTAFASESSLATWAAVEYFTRPAHARRLVQELRAAYGAVPDEFEVVVRGRFVDGFPVEIDHLAHRRVDRAAMPAPAGPPRAAR